jgi:hypothetical protein
VGSVSPHPTPIKKKGKVNSYMERYLLYRRSDVTIQHHKTYVSWGLGVYALIFINALIFTVNGGYSTGFNRDCNL